jgi:hypothetical protein
MASPTKVMLKLFSAGVKRTRAVVRSLGATTQHPDWQARAETCQRCPLVYMQCGKVYCGKPLLNQLDRDEPTQGCGCPVILKAKDPKEHCPRDLHFSAPTTANGVCNCMWCAQQSSKNAA